MELVTLFYIVDEFCKEFETGEKQRIRSSTMTLSEVITFCIWFHASGYRQFKKYYINYICGQHGADFPSVVSYVKLTSGAIMPLLALMTNLRAPITPVNFVDSTTLDV